MHSMLPDYESRPITPSNWTSLTFKMTMGGNLQEGTSVYEKTDAIGCAKASEGYGAEAAMCFNDETIKNEFTGYSGAAKPGCKSRSETYSISEPHNYRAYKLCDDESCSGAHDCKESGPINNLQMYTCKAGTEGTTNDGYNDGSMGCSYEDRDIQGYMYIWSAAEGPQLSTYENHMWGMWGEPMPPPSPPSPPPAAAYTPLWPDGTEVWKEDYNGDDEKMTLRRLSGRLTKVSQHRMRLCDMPGAYHLGEMWYSHTGDGKISFEAETPGGCTGSLRERRGVEVGDVVIIGREHLDRHLSPEKEQYVVLQSGSGGGARYRLPVETKYWQVLKFKQEWTYNYHTNEYTVTSHRFNDLTIPKGTVLAADLVQQGQWHYNYETHNYEHVPGSTTALPAMTVAATTYQFTLSYDRAEVFNMKKAAIESDPACQQQCAGYDDWECLNNRPYKCMELECTVLDFQHGVDDPATCGVTMYGETCQWCNQFWGGGSYVQHYTKLRKEASGGADKGDIVAEVLYRVDWENHDWNSPNKTFVIQCIETTGDDATDGSATWLPKDVGTTPGCGLTIGEWLTDVQGGGSDPYGWSPSESYLGKVISLDRLSSVMVTTEELLPRENTWNMDIVFNGTASSGTLPDVWNGSAASSLDGVSMRYDEWKSFPGEVSVQPAGDAMVNYTLRETVKHTDTIHGLKCLHNCIDPDRMGTSANPPVNNSVVKRYSCSQPEYSYGGGVDCSAPQDEYSWNSDEVKVPLANFTFHEYSWQAGSGLLACEPSSERRRRLSESTENSYSMYELDECTRNVAVPQGTPLERTCYSDSYNGDYCYQQSWQVKSILFRGDVTIRDFRCAEETSEGTSPPPSSPSSPDSLEACLAVLDDNNRLVANTDDLDEYFEFETSVPQEWGSVETIWLESEGDEVRLEPPMTLNLKVPEDEDGGSLSGISYAGKSVVLQYSDGIDIYNSPGFPMWCLNMETAALKEPIVDEWGWTTCVNYTAWEIECYGSSTSGGMYGRRASEATQGTYYTYEASATGDHTGGAGDYTGPEPLETCDWSAMNFQLYPDILPDIHWEGVDGSNRKWGLKPSEKTIVFKQVEEGNCSQTVTNPITLEGSGAASSDLQQKGRRFREEVSDLLAWYRENKDDESHVRVHTGKFVGEAALLAEQSESGSGDSGSG